MKARPPLLAVIGLAIAIGAPELDIGRLIAPGSDLASLLVHEAVWWVLILAIVGYVVGVERLGLRSIGLRTPDWKSFALAIPFAMLMVAIVMVSYGIVFPALHLHVNVAAQTKILHTPLWYRVLLVARAAVAEEIIYRGYTIERIA
ncbi:MAG: hypothetical protein ACYC8V_14765, partial [Caulobacteraceae bacterium]